MRSPQCVVGQNTKHLSTGVKPWGCGSRRGGEDRWMGPHFGPPQPIWADEGGLVEDSRERFMAFFRAHGMVVPRTMLQKMAHGGR